MHRLLRRKSKQLHPKIIANLAEGARSVLNVLKEIRTHKYKL